MTVYNLTSPNSIYSQCNLDDLDKWYENEVEQAAYLTESEKRLLFEVQKNITGFIEWPKTSDLLMKGVDRTPIEIVVNGKTKKQKKFHTYKKEIKLNAKSKDIKKLDNRPNGPALLSFLLAGGNRPPRNGNNNGWTIHHIYSGKFPYKDKESTLHAVNDGLHFTQSAGFIAAHPILDSICDEYPFFAWYLRALSYKKFSYDPDNVFCSRIDILGFEVDTVL